MNIQRKKESKNVYSRVVEKVLSLTKILDLLYPSHVSIGLTCTQIKIEIWIFKKNF